MSAISEKIQKLYRRSKTTSLIGIIVLLVTAALIAVGIAYYNSARKDVADLNSVIQSSAKDKAGKIAYLDMYGCYSFASDDSKSYYIAYDDNYLYIITMTDKEFKNAEKKYNAAGDGTFRLYGKTVSIPSEAKPFAIEAYNEEAGSNYANLSNFEDLFGDVCLSVRDEKKLNGLGGFLDVSGGFLLASLFTLISGLVLFFTGRSRANSFLPLIEDSDNALVRELESESTVPYEKIGVYLTDDHLVSMLGNLNAIKYSDIFWAYVTEHRTNGIHDYNYLNLITKEGKQVTFGNSGSLGKKKRAGTQELHTDILKKIYEKNPEVMIGFNRENQQAYMELRKQLKESKKK